MECVRNTVSKEVSRTRSGHRAEKLSLQPDKPAGICLGSLIHHNQVSPGQAQGDMLVMGQGLLIADQPVLPE